MSITICRATAGDAHDYAYVLCESWKAAYKDIITPYEMKKNTDIEARARFFEKMIPSGNAVYLIARDGDTACGICALSSSRDDDMCGAGEVIAIYALPEYWGRGVGKKLMDSAIDALRADGFESVMLWAFEENTRARRFYERYGFSFSGTYKDSGFTNAKEVRYTLSIKALQD